MQWGAFYLFIVDFFATQIIGGTKELVVLLWSSGDIYYKQWTKRVGSPLEQRLIFNMLAVSWTIFDGRYYNGQTFFNSLEIWLKINLASSFVFSSLLTSQNFWTRKFSSLKSKKRNWNGMINFGPNIIWRILPILWLYFFRSNIREIDEPHPIPSMNKESYLFLSTVQWYI